MSRTSVKILKSEVWDNDMPAICMVCGENPAQTSHPTTMKHVFFPLSMLGFLGQLITPKKIPFNICCCNDCKPGYLNEVNMQIIWSVLKTLVMVYFVFVFTVQSSGLPKNLLGPVIAFVIAIILETVYFWTIGKKHAIRCGGMDDGTVSIDLPQGKWGLEYSKYKREKNQHRKAAKGPVHEAAPSAAPAGGDTPPPPAGTPTLASAIAGSSGGSGAAGSSGPTKLFTFEGSEHCQIPPQLPDFLTAVKEGDADRLAEVLKDGGDLAETLPNGMNALHLASMAGVMQMADLLIRKGIDVNSEMANGLTPMHLAVQSNNQNMVGLLLAKKGNPNHPNKEGRTPLHWCAAVADERLDPNNRFKMAQVLLRGGGDTSVKDKDGKTPADLAKETGDSEMTDIFS